MFKKSMQSKPKGTVPTQEAVQMLYAFMKYCQGKMDKLRAEFPGRMQSGTLNIQDPSGYRDHTNFYNVESMLLHDNNLKEATTISLGGHWDLNLLQGGATNKHIISVKCTITSEASKWVFNASDKSRPHGQRELFAEEYQGNDLDAAKKCFNNALRAIMRAVSQAR